MTTISDTVPVPIIAGPEMEALARFHQDVTWDGGRRTAWFRSEGPSAWDLWLWEPGCGG
jgi:hypothetical protein